MSTWEYQVQLEMALEDAIDWIDAHKVIPSEHWADKDYFLKYLRDMLSEDYLHEFNEENK